MQRSESEDLIQQRPAAPEVQTSADDLVSHIKAALQTGDCMVAEQLLREGDSNFPGDSRFPQLHVQLSRLVRRFDDFETALGEATAELANQLFAASLGRFREALNLGRGVPGLQERVFNTAIERAEELLERNWRIAESLLSEASKLDSHLKVPTQLWEQIHREQRDETISNALDEAERAETNIDLLHARDRLAALLNEYPGEAQIEERLKSLDLKLIEECARERETRLRILANSRDKLEHADDPDSLRNFVRFREPLLGSYRSDLEFAAILSEVDELASSYDEAAVALADNRCEECLERCRKILSHRPANRLFLDLEERAKVRELCLHPGELQDVTPASEPELAIQKLDIEHAGVSVAPPKDPAPVAKPVRSRVVGLLRQVQPLIANAAWSSGKTAVAATVLGVVLVVFFSALIFRVATKEPGKPVRAAKNSKQVADNAASPMSALSARIEIRDALPGTQISVDGAEVANVSSKEPLAVSISAGSHIIGLSRKGFVRKQVNHDFAPGDRLLLAGSAVQLESSGGRVAVTVIQRDDHLNADNIAAGKEAAGGPQREKASKTNSELPEQLLAKNQDGLQIGDGRELAQKANPTSEEQFEKSDWDGVDKSSNEMLHEFLTKHPNGRYSSAALETIASLDRSAKAELMRIEEEAWSAVNPLERSSIESYAGRFPSGKHRPEADEALSTLAKADLLRRESAAVLAVLRQYVSAWNAKDTDSIVSLQRGLDRRVVRAELSPIKSLVMSLSPTADPQIDGTQATVRCRSQVAEVFSDGIEKKTPETTITFVLTKRNGAWTIDGTRQSGS